MSKPQYHDLTRQVSARPFTPGEAPHWGCLRASARTMRCRFMDGRPGLLTRSNFPLFRVTWGYRQILLSGDFVKNSEAVACRSKRLMSLELSRRGKSQG